MLTITRAGLAAITSVATNGFKISLTSFKVSEYVGPQTGSDLVNATDLLGTSVYTGEITVVETVGTSTIKLTLSLPKELPRTGSWFLRELGIYLSTGELFAIGALNPAYEKNSEYGIKIYAICSANKLGQVVNVNINQNNSLPLIAHVNSLPSPIDSEHAVLAVLDQIKSEYADSATAGIAIKSGPGLLHWSFSDHHRIFYGPADSIVNVATFIVSPATGGFWLTDGEIVIGQIVSGSGAGQARRLSYNEATHEFAADLAFVDLNATSIIALWRDNAKQLPARKSTIPEYMVLGHGLNSWRRIPLAPAITYTYSANSISSVLNGDSQLGATFIEPLNSNNVMLVWCEGLLIPEGQYSSTWGVITVYGKPAGTKIDVTLLKRIVATAVAGAEPVGSVLTLFESRNKGDGQTTRFYLSMVPTSRSWISVYVDGVLKHQSEYEFNRTNIVFYTAPAANAIVNVVQYGLYDEQYGSTSASRTFRQLTSGTSLIELTEVPANMSNVAVFVDGKQYAHSDFQIVTQGLQLVKTPTYPGGTSFVDIIVFTPSIASVNPYATLSVEGLNTGPVWTDPAGLEGPPNRLKPKSISVVSDGATTLYHVAAVPNRDHVLVFAGGAFVQPDAYSWASGVDESLVVLNVPVQAGTVLDIVCFTEITLDEGFDVQCTSFNVLSTTDTFYQLDTVNDVEDIIVTVGGVYQHKMNYEVDPSSVIYFQGILPNLPIEVWHWKTVVHPGWRTTVRYNRSTAITANSYPMAQSVSRKQNVLTFVGTTKYDSSKYDINGTGDKVSLSPNAATNTNITTVSFSSAAPKTRLLTREEYNNSVVSFNYRTGAIFLTREDVKAVLTREDVLALLTDAERAILNGAGGGGGGTVEPPHALPGNVFVSSTWVVPSGVYHIRAVIIGGGGGGGGGSADLVFAGHGGKRGEVLIRELDVVPGQALEVRLGVGGSSYLYTMAGDVVYPQPGDLGTSDGSRGYPGRNGENTIFHQWVAAGGLGGGSEPSFAPTYALFDAKGEDQVPMVGTGTFTGGGAAGQTGVQTPGNNVLSYSYPGTNGALGWSVTNSTGGGYSATSPGAGGGGGAGDPIGVGSFGGAGANGVIYISW